MTTNVQRWSRLVQWSLLCALLATSWPAASGFWSALSECSRQFRWYVAVHCEASHLDRAIQLAQVGTTEREGIAKKVVAGEMTVAQGLTQCFVSLEGDESFQMALRSFFPHLPTEVAMRRYFYRTVMEYTTDRATTSRLELQFSELNRDIAEMPEPNGVGKPHSG